jgi:cellulose synthase/poly-beta-1,6-N-acetylglucosamine synthase-like glycosyltransferase
MEALEITFWLSATCVGYACAGYAVILAVLVKVRRRPVHRLPGFKPRVSIITCAHNEESFIGTRVDELAQLLEASEVEGEIIVVSDGSTDSTAEKARCHGGSNVQVLELAERGGKAAALNAGCAAAQYPILILADTRQRWNPTALRMLLENFADPTVGAVSGDLVVETAPGVMAGVGFYWRHEKWLRNQESLLHSTVGVTGAICAVRRALFPYVPPGTLLDDVYWPLRVVLQGHRIVHDTRAVAYDRLPERARDEFRRKVRTLAGNFQLIARLPGALLPWRNPVWWQFVSHKVLRLLVPWALLTMLVTNLFLSGPIYRTILSAQICFYALALLGHVPGIGRRVRPAAAAASMLVLNAAAWLAFWVWVSGRSHRSWRKVVYKTQMNYSMNRLPVP